MGSVAACELRGEVNDTQDWDLIARSRQELHRIGGPVRELEWEGDDPDQLFRELALDCASRVANVLDLGCGEGRFGREMAEEAGCVIGLEISRVAVEAAMQPPAPENLCFVRADARALPFVADAFDLVCSRRGPGAESIETLAEVRRVLRPGAMLVGLAVGELHRIEAQEIFGRGQHWPPAKPVRFAIPEKLAEAGLKLASFAEYYASGYYPDIAAYAALLGATPIIPRFNPEKDAIFLREVARKLTTDRGIRDTEHMAIFVAAKPG